MSVKILTENHFIQFEKEFNNARNSIKIMSPFLDKETCTLLLNSKIKNRKLITKFEKRDFCLGVNNLSALEMLLNDGVEIVIDNKLHSKLYIFDNICAISGSANFTYYGLHINHEITFHFKAPEHIEEILQMQKYYDDLYDNSQYKITLKDIKAMETEVKKHQEFIKKYKKEFSQKNESDNDTIKNFKKLTGVLKFEYSSDNRHSGDNVYTAAKYDDMYFTCTPTNNGRPIMLSKDKIIFITVMSYDKNGEPAPMIVGRARTHGYIDKKHNMAGNDMQKLFPHTKHFGYYINLYNIEIINADIRQCISLNNIKRRVSITSHNQRSYVKISDDAKNYINIRLENMFKKYGRNEKLYQETCTKY